MKAKLASVHPGYLRHLMALEKRAIAAGWTTPTAWEAPSERTNDGERSMSGNAKERTLAERTNGREALQLVLACARTRADRIEEYGEGTYPGDAREEADIIRHACNIVEALAPVETPAPNDWTEPPPVQETRIVGGVSPEKVALPEWDDAPAPSEPEVREPEREIVLAVEQAMREARGIAPDDYPLLASISANALRHILAALRSPPAAPTQEPDAAAFLAEENRRLKLAGDDLAVAALRVTTEYDGVHRLRLAIAAWSKAVADEGGRAALYRGAPAAPPVPDMQELWDIDQQVDLRGWWHVATTIKMACHAAGMPLVTGDRDAAGQVIAYVNKALTMALSVGPIEI